MCLTNINSEWRKQVKLKETPVKIHSLKVQLVCEID
jgi:hypothetical protein